MSRPILDQLRTATSRRLLDIIEKGRPLVEDGHIVMGEDGKPVMLPPTNDDLETAVKLIKQLQAGAPAPKIGTGRAMPQAPQRSRKAIAEVPPLDMEGTDPAVR